MSREEMLVALLILVAAVGGLALYGRRCQRREAIARRLEREQTDGHRGPPLPPNAPGPLTAIAESS